MSSKNLLLFLVKVIVLFFLLLWLWVYVTPIISIFLAKIVNAIMTWLYPQFIQVVNYKNNYLEVITYFAVAGDAKGQLAFDMNPLKYGYGLPLYCALLLVSPARWGDKVWYFLIGFCLLFLTQIWGVCFDMVRHLVFDFNAVYAAYFGYSALVKNLISLASQLGFLLLPSLVPVVLWAALMQDFIRELIAEKKSC